MEYLITTAMGVVKKALDNGVLLAEVSYFVLEKVLMYADNLSNRTCSHHRLNNGVPRFKGLCRLEILKSKGSNLAKFSRHQICGCQES